MFALTMTGSLLSLAPGWQDLLLGSSLWAERIFAEVSTLKCFSVPTQPLETEFCQAGGLCPRNRINPVYLFLFILLKREMFALYNHPPPGAAQRSSPQHHPEPLSKEEVPLSSPKPEIGLGWLL